MLKNLLSLSLLSFFAINSYSQDWNQVIKGVASDRAAGDKFGTSVAVFGNYAVVGAPGANAAYVFKNISGTWAQTQILSTNVTRTEFGIKVAIYENYIVIGSNDNPTSEDLGFSEYSDSSYVYVFKNIAETWTEIKRLEGSDIQINDRFGSSLDIYGEYIVVGAMKDADIDGLDIIQNSGSAYVFQNNGDSWTEVQKITASDRSIEHQFGNSVSISGDYLVVGDKDYYRDPNIIEHVVLGAGSIYIFKNSNGVWTEQQKLIGSDVVSGDSFGCSVSIDKENVIVGAKQQSSDLNGLNPLINAGAVYVFKNTNDVWSEVQKITASDRNIDKYFGASVSIDNEYFVVGSVFHDNYFY